MRQRNPKGRYIEGEIGKGNTHTKSLQVSLELYILEIRMRSRVPRAANVYLLRTRSRVTFKASLQQVCTGRELG